MVAAAGAEGDVHRCGLDLTHPDHGDLLRAMSTGARGSALVQGCEDLQRVALHYVYKMPASVAGKEVPQASPHVDCIHGSS